MAETSATRSAILKAYMAHQELTVTETARILGIHRCYLSRILSGHLPFTNSLTQRCNKQMRLDINHVFTDPNHFLFC